jgi:hypothetical protein
MIKTYQLTTPARNSSIVLRGKTNNSMRYNFTGGDPLTGKAASIMLKSQYAQDLLEQSDIFKQGLVMLVKTNLGGETPIEKKPTITVMEDITTPEKLIEFVGEKLEKVYQRPEAALNFAKNKGYEFPNLVLKKEEG